MNSPESLVVGLYFATLVCLSVYGAHRAYLVYLYTRYRKVVRTPAALPDAKLPAVTVQLPIYNELYVVERLIDAVASFDYPAERLQIQVLDDSTDETRRIARRVVARWAAAGVDIQYLARPDRAGFKAGALASGLVQARGELIAIFDADFVPAPDFLRRVVPSFADPGVGMVQTRWEHLNRESSLLTRVQALFLDAHFVLEHGARHRAGCFFNFNGTAGVWRREAIETAGGWQYDTLTEDLDLSYRAQLAGWRFVFRSDVTAPAELPVEMNAFKTQQHRWAKGSVQTCLKVLPAVFRADVPIRVKVEACFHLTANVNYLLMTLLALLMVPALLVRGAFGWQTLLLVDLPLFCAATLSVANFYGLSQRELGRGWRARLASVPAAMAVGIGLSVNNTRAVLGALRGRGGEFARTPKYGVTPQGDADWRHKRYRQFADRQPFVEIAFGLYYGGAVVYAVSAGLLATVPFLLLFHAGYLYTGLLTLVQQHAGDGAEWRAPSSAATGGRPAPLGQRAAVR